MISNQCVVIHHLLHPLEVPNLSYPCLNSFDNEYALPDNPLLPWLTGPKGDPILLLPAGEPAYVQPFPFGTTAYGKAFDLSATNYSKLKSAISFAALALYRLLVASTKALVSVSSLQTKASRFARQS